MSTGHCNGFAGQDKHRWYRASMTLMCRGILAIALSSTAFPAYSLESLQKSAKVFNTQVGGAIANTTPISITESPLPDLYSHTLLLGHGKGFGALPQTLSHGLTKANIAIASDHEGMTAEVPSPSETQADLDEAETVASELSPIDSSELQSGSSDVATEEGDDWEFIIEPYLFLPTNVEADVTVAGREASMEADLGDILNLDSIFAASLRLEGRRDRFGLILDGSYMFAQEEGEQEVTIPQAAVAQFGLTDDLEVDADTTVTARLGTIDLAGFYRVVDDYLGTTDTGEDTYPRLFIDPVVGLRLNFVSQDLEIESIDVGNVALDDQDFNRSVTLLEPMIGARIGLDLSERWAIGMRGDVSGFGINGDENLTWNFLAGTQYWLSRSTALQLAYRINQFIYEDGDGTDSYGLDLTQEGLWLGMVFRL